MPDHGIFEYAEWSKKYPKKQPMLIRNERLAGQCLISAEEREGYQNTASLVEQTPEGFVRYGGPVSRNWQLYGEDEEGPEDWNPDAPNGPNSGLSPGYNNLLSGWSYCVEAINEPVVTIGPIRQHLVEAVLPRASRPPPPTQPDIVNNCDTFDFMEKGMSYSNVLSKNGITLKQLAAWNPSVKDNYSGL
ncbi:hypothetical protein NW753_014537 [Fusarium oxysporum]|nr:hypothetical protein NW758_014846 [Fusarium oxysporum]KAJ4027420.1 hypothetical protein NW753_014537 [Fusarium oxysporum]